MPDGTLIQWGTATIPANSNWTRCSFSVPMIDTNYTASASISYSGSWATAMSFGGKDTNYIDMNVGATSGSRAVDWLAVGRWK